MLEAEGVLPVDPVGDLGSDELDDDLRELFADALAVPLFAVDLIAGDDLDTLAGKNIDALVVHLLEDFALDLCDLGLLGGHQLLDLVNPLDLLQPGS